MINTKNLKELTETDIEAAHLRSNFKPDRAFVDRKEGWVIQVYEEHWDWAVAIAVKHSRAKTRDNFQKRGFSAPIEWDDMQAIKDFLYPGQIGVEVFPPLGKVVDVADMRWIWVLPKGSYIPFSLENKSHNLLSSDA